MEGSSSEPPEEGHRVLNHEGLSVQGILGNVHVTETLSVLHHHTHHPHITLLCGFTHGEDRHTLQTHTTQADTLCQKQRSVQEVMHKINTDLVFRGFTCSS